jgi:hypothetical protein
MMKWLSLLAVPWLLTAVTADVADFNHHLRGGQDLEHRMLQLTTAVLVVANANASWEAGALNLNGSVPGSAFIGNVTVYNDPTTGRVLFHNKTNCWAAPTVLATTACPA